MAQEVVEHYWICNKYPWKCSIKHKTEEEAIACEKQETIVTRVGLSNYRSFLGKLIRK